MDRRLVTGALAGVAAVLLATGGSTLAAFDDAAAVPHNTAGAGVLVLDLGASDSAATAVRFAGLLPGHGSRVRIWLAHNDPSSTVAGRLLLTVDRLVDTPAPCNLSLGKAAGEIASHIEGCHLAGNRASGRPSIGVASRVLQVSGTYVPDADSEDGCEHDGAAAKQLFPDNAPGNLHAMARAHDGRGTVVPLRAADGRSLVLEPGAGVCVSLDAYFPPDVTSAANASPRHPVDNAAQGDSLSVRLRFSLVQQPGR